ncbi:hypothetical protein MM213_16075 [Belliella sp. R4-6]|uniref:Uncharacterized protein n=1 Tax=Belliella alkalica TaxID=1730871 RepID=A0ABS9VF07_9BACT|nr:hypothetical protein [Belliella alkalica]MCH7415019.1 hypothetical protein [Belliella alkalica]
MKRNNDHKLDLSVISYYIVEKDTVLIEKITKALSTSHYKCLGVSTSSKKIENKLSELIEIPDIIFIGDVNRPLELINNISIQYSGSRLLRVYSKDKFDMLNSSFDLRERLGSFLII